MLPWDFAQHKTFNFPKFIRNVILSGINSRSNRENGTYFSARGIWYDISSGRLSQGCRKLLTQTTEGQCHNFASSGPSDDCSAIPDEILSGHPETAICKEAEVDTEACVCIQRPPGLRPHVKKLLALMQGLNKIDGVDSSEEDESMELEDMESGDEGEFVNICGKCADPCALRIRPNRDGKKSKKMMDSAKDMSKVGMQLMEMLVQELSGAAEEEEAE